MARTSLAAFGRVPLGWRLVSHDWVRFAVTVSGTGAALALMLFLASAYDGVKVESNGYVAGRPAGAWVAQGNASNLVRATSFMNPAWPDILRDSPAVGSVAPMLRLVLPVTIHGKSHTAFVWGIDPSLPATRPTVVLGDANLDPGEIILDRALARKADVTIGGTVGVQDRTFRVAGLSVGTNAVMTQFTFVRLEEANELLPITLRNVLSFLLITPKPGVSVDALVGDLRGRQDELNVLTSPEFVENNLDELRSGLLPILGTIGIFGAAVGSLVLTLLVYSSVLERREDYTLLKAIGAGPGYVRRLVLGQCLLAVAWGYGFGFAICVAIRPVLAWAVPVFVMSLSWPASAVIGLAAIAMGLTSAWLPLHQIERIYPAEVFRA